MIDIDRIEQLAKAAPSGKWEIHTSNSWRRIYANQGREKVCVIEPTTQHDRWPDLMFGPGVPEFLEGLTPDVALALIAEVRALRELQVPPGFVTVPIEPTDEILYAGYGSHYRFETTLGKRAAKKDYAELIQAARGAK